MKHFRAVLWLVDRVVWAVCCCGRNLATPALTPALASSSHHPPAVDEPGPLGDHLQRDLTVAARLQYGPFGVSMAGRSLSASVPFSLAVSLLFSNSKNCGAS